MLFFGFFFVCVSLLCVVFCVLLLLFVLTYGDDDGDVRMYVCMKLYI